MLNFFKSLMGKKKEDSPEYRILFVDRIKDKKIKYVTERSENRDTGEIVDTIIGRDAIFYLNPNNGEVSIFCDGTSEAIFRAPASDVYASEFMSLEGVIINAHDLVQNRPRQIIAYYKYHRE